MKVLFFLRRIGPYHDARFTAASGIVDLVTVETRPGSLEYPWEFHAKGKYKREKFPVGIDPETGVRGTQLTELVTLLIGKEKPDVIVTTGWADAEYHTVALLSQRRKIPLIVISDSRFEDEPRSTHKEFVKRLILKSYSAAVVAGKSSRRYLELLGFNPAAIFQPWDVVDNNHFRSVDVSIAFDHRPFLCIARFVEKKNIEGLIRAFSKYLEAGGNRNLQIVGSGELESTLRQTAASAGVGNKVVFREFAQYEALPAIFRSAFFIILPSFTDQWGLVVNEGMAAGLPVLVSSKCGCATDLVQDSNNGFIFDPSSVEEIFRALKRSDIAENEWQKLSACSTDIIGHWTTSDFADALKDAGEYAIAHSSARSFLWIHKILASWT